MLQEFSHRDEHLSKDFSSSFLAYFAYRQRTARGWNASYESRYKVKIYQTYLRFNQFQEINPTCGGILNDEEIKLHKGSILKLKENIKKVWILENSF